MRERSYFWGVALALKGLDYYKEFLQEQGYRVTQSRLSVAAILLKFENQHLSSEEIFHHIQKSKKYNCDQASVYRALALYVELGLVLKSSFQGEASRYSLSDVSEKHSHKHYFKCIKCNVVEPFGDCLVGKKEKELEQKGYTQLTHHLEITGLCPGCAMS